MNAEDLRSILKAPDALERHSFSVLQQIARLSADPAHAETAHELILRALEHQTRFGPCSAILTSLARTAGLFPYLQPESLHLKDALAYEFHRPPNMRPDFVFHREQAEVYRRLLDGDNVILSAPTSFGKSRIIDAIIASGKFDTIVIVVPTLALIDETRRRLSEFSTDFKIVTHLTQKPAKRTIFVFTAERAVAYDAFETVQFFVIDEFYKIGALEENPERTVALNQAFYKLRNLGGQFYLLGPSIKQIPDGLEQAYRCYFYPTTFTTVVSEQVRVELGGDSEVQRLVKLCNELTEPTLIFCRSPARVNEVARALVSAGVGTASPALRPAANWIARHYHPDWVLREALEHGIGIHHGRLPRSLAQYVVRMFNELKLRFLVCTSTLIEGVNTKAKNVVVFDNKIAKQRIDFFTFNNIRGRSGRMFQHFVGRVFLFHEPPTEQLPFVDFPLFSQDKTTPESLLIQMAPEDLSPTARARLQPYRNQELLPLQVLQENSSIEPEAQLNLAREVMSGDADLLHALSWSGMPTNASLTRICELIWKHFVVKKNRGGVYSDKQLAFKLWQLFKEPSTQKRVLDELKPGQYAAKTADEAVERVLDFDRTWAAFEFPRYLMATSRIQKVVLPKRGQKPGDYAHFASQSESLFLPPVVAALDEYGVPTQVGTRLAKALGSTTDLDVALARFAELDVTKLGLDPFEVEVVIDAQRGL